MYISNMHYLSNPETMHAEKMSLIWFTLVLLNVIYFIYVYFLCKVSLMSITTGQFIKLCKII